MEPINIKLCVNQDGQFVQAGQMLWHEKLPDNNLPMFVFRGEDRNTEGLTPVRLSNFADFQKVANAVLAMLKTDRYVNIIVNNEFDDDTSFIDEILAYRSLEPLLNQKGMALDHFVELYDESLGLDWLESFQFVSSLNNDKGYAVVIVRLNGIYIYGDDDLSALGQKLMSILNDLKSSNKISVTKEDNVI